MDICKRKNRIAEALSMRNMKQVELCERCKIGKSTMSAWIHQRWQPSQTPLHKMGKVLDVNELWLAGYDIPMERPVKQKELDQMADIIRELRKNDRFKAVVENIFKLNDEQFTLIENMINQLTPYD